MADVALYVVGGDVVAMVAREVAVVPVDAFVVDGAADVAYATVVVGGADEEAVLVDLVDVAVDVADVLPDVTVEAVV